MKSLLHVLFVVCLFTISASIVQACSCADPSQRSKFRRADVVFLGEITRYTFLGNISKDSQLVQSASFQVKRQWKGAKQKEIRLLLPIDGPGTCGDMPLTVGMQYLVYAYREKEGLVTYGDCGPNVPAGYANEDIKKLNSFWFRLSARLWLFN